MPESVPADRCPGQQGHDKPVPPPSSGSQMWLVCTRRQTNRSRLRAHLKQSSPLTMGPAGQRPDSARAGQLALAWSPCSMTVPSCTADGAPRSASRFRSWYGSPAAWFAKVEGVGQRRLHDPLFAMRTSARAGGGARPAAAAGTDTSSARATASHAAACRRGQAARLIADRRYGSPRGSRER